MCPLVKLHQQKFWSIFLNENAGSFWIYRNVNRCVNYHYFHFLAATSICENSSMSYLWHDKHFPIALCLGRDSNPCKSIESQRPGTFWRTLYLLSYRAKAYPYNLSRDQVHRFIEGLVEIVSKWTYASVVVEVLSSFALANATLGHDISHRTWKAKIRFGCS